MDGIRIKAEDISINEKGEVVIRNPMLAEALKKETTGTRGTGGKDPAGFLDLNYKCKTK